MRLRIDPNTLFRKILNMVIDTVVGATTA